MEQIGGEDAGQRTSLWQVIGASVIGTIMEWYDFFIFAAAAALVFPALFFPEREPPQVIAYIKDKDLWQWRLPDSRAITSASAK